MNWRAVWAIVRKDLKTVRQNRMIFLPMLLVPLLFLVVMPAGAVLLASNGDAIADFQQDAAMFFANLPPGIQTELDRFTTEPQRFTYLMAGYLFAPLFLIVPLMVSTTLGADSFAGEKERKTMEALLYTPLTDFEMYVGKLLAALIPSVLVCLIGGLAYAVVVNLAAWNTMGGIFFPNLMWIALIVWLAPAAAGLGLAAIIFFSARAKTVQEAYQIGGMVVLPIILLVVGQMAGLLYLSLEFVLLAGLIVWLIDIGLLWLGARTFQRSELIARL